MIETTENEFIAEEYLRKSMNEPWECTARDVRILASRLRSCEEARLAAERKYGEVLKQSIDHSHAMLGNVLNLCLEKAQQQDADKSEKTKTKKKP